MCGSVSSFTVCSVHHIRRAIKANSRRLVWHVACMAEKRNAYRVLVGGNLKESDHLKDLGVDGRITLKIYLK